MTRHLRIRPEFIESWWSIMFGLCIGIALLGVQL
jgi:hypothetical protein